MHDALLEMTVQTLQFQRKLFKFFLMISAFILVFLGTLFFVLCLESSQELPIDHSLILVGYPALVVMAVLALSMLVVMRCTRQLADMGLS